MEPHLPTSVAAATQPDAARADVGAPDDDRQALQDRLQAAESALRETRAEMQAFIRAVAHDVKGPIGSIGVVLNNMLQSEAERLRPAAKRMLQLVSVECDRMVQLVDELATLGMVDQRQLQPGPVAMQTLAQAALDELQSGGAADKAACASRSRVQLPVEQPLPMVHGDATLLRLVWQQLLANAMKFSAKAENALVEVRCEQRGGEWLFTVSDNGAGFDMQHAGRLFELFQRLHKASDFPGTGVGLAIVRRALQRQGGRAWAESAPGQGARFHFTLPA